MIRDLSNMTVAEILSSEDRFVEQQVLLAAAFGVAAYEKHVGCDVGAVCALKWAFLTALADPLSAELDHLRQCPEMAEAARISEAAR
jgi:hypothetical protein